MAIVVVEASDVTVVSTFISVVADCPLLEISVIAVEASATGSTVVASENAIIGRALYSIQMTNIKEIKKFDRIIYFKK